MYFLDLVGTGGVPTATVTISDNIVNWFEENTKEFLHNYIPHKTKSQEK